VRPGTDHAPTTPDRAQNRTVTVGDYLVSLNLPQAVAVGGILVVIGLVLLRFLLATSSEVGQMLPGAGNAAGKALLDARDLPLDSWVCVNCRSVNTPHATHCYRGCGGRDELAEPLPTDRSIVADPRNGGRAR
jgi:ribosomal protein L40E